jgi:hypothetical protein
VSGLGLGIYISPCTGGKSLFTGEIIIYHCLGLDTYTHPSTRGMIIYMEKEWPWSR